MPSRSDRLCSSTDLDIVFQTSNQPHKPHTHVCTHTIHIIAVSDWQRQFCVTLRTGRVYYKLYKPQAIHNRGKINVNSTHMFVGVRSQTIQYTTTTTFRRTINHIVETFRHKQLLCSVNDTDSGWSFHTKKQLQAHNSW